MNRNVFVTRAAMPPMEEYLAEIRDLWDSHWITNMGVKHETLRRELKAFLGVKEIDLVTNGHMALELSLQAMHLSGEVITTPFTFASTTHAIVRNGLKPVFCDISQEDFTMDPAQIEGLITDRTSAILPVHVYGNLCRVEEIQRIARKHGLKVLYDAAHAFGVTYKGRGAGSFGDVSCFSFHATKVFNTIEGGAVCFGDEDFGLDFYRLKNFGIRGPERVDAVGANAKMNEFCAAMGLCNLRHIQEQFEAREQVEARYRRWLEGVDGLQLNCMQPDVRTNHAYFPVVVNKKIFGASRNEILEAMAQNGVFGRKYFYPLTSMFECFHGQYDPSDTPNALHVSRRVMTLPMYGDLSLEEVDRICRIILECRKPLVACAGGKV